MEKRWYPVWDPEVPKSFEPEKPLFEYLRETALSMPNRIAISFYGYDMTYKELNEAIDRFAGGLAELGVKRGDRVGLYMQNCPQFVISYFGILRAGGIVVPLNPMYKHAELEHNLIDSGAETLVTADALYTEVAKIKDRVKLKNVIVTSLRDYLPQKPTLPLPSEAEQPEADFPGTLGFLEVLRQSSAKPTRETINLKEDIALLQYTGGTTGVPKGAMLTHYNLVYADVASILWFKYTRDDVHLGLAPFFHVMGMMLMGAQLISGGQVVMLARFFPEVTAKAISQYKCTTLITVPTGLIALLKLPDIKHYDFGSLRALVSGGAPLPQEIRTRLQALAPRAVIVEGYGLTETLAEGGVLTPLHCPKPGFMGIPNIGVDMKIMDLATGSQEVMPNEEGEILIKGPTVMRGYWNKPKETSEVLRDGWVSTGDIGIMDEEGYVRVAGRKKEMILCSGFNVYPTEVEDLLYKHPAIAEVAVIGIPDPYRGESPKAFVVLKPEYKGKIREEEIIKWSKENMAAYKRPHVVEFRDELPKSGATKLLRRVLAKEERVKTQSKYNIQNSSAHASK